MKQFRLLTCLLLAASLTLAFSYESKASYYPDVSVYVPVEIASLEAPSVQIENEGLVITETTVGYSNTVSICESAVTQKRSRGPPEIIS